MEYILPSPQINQLALVDAVDDLVKERPCAFANEEIGNRRLLTTTPDSPSCTMRGSIGRTARDRRGAYLAGARRFAPHALIKRGTAC
jgi:hypothetical protein